MGKPAYKHWRVRKIHRPPSPHGSVSCILVLQETGDTRISARLDTVCDTLLGLDNLNYLAPEVKGIVLTGSDAC